jgi:ABC-2 type transporter
VLGNMAVAIAVSLLQVTVLIVAGWLRGSHFHITVPGAGWFGGAVLSFTVFMYAVSEILANRIPTQEEYVGLTPVVAILPWFLAGSLFPVTALPGWLAAVARALPTTHPGTAALRGTRPRRHRPARHLGHRQQHR